MPPPKKDEPTEQERRDRAEARKEMRDDKRSPEERTNEENRERAEARREMQRPAEIARERAEKGEKADDDEA